MPPKRAVITPKPFAHPLEKKIKMNYFPITIESVVYLDFDIVDLKPARICSLRGACKNSVVRFKIAFSNCN